VCADDPYCCDTQWDSTCVNDYATPICLSSNAPEPSASPTSPLLSMFDDFECFGEKKKNYFANEPYAEITNLPQVRLMMCGYESQCALQFAAYLFMSEKLGMNVTFYPTLDYDNIWSAEHWDDWKTLAYPRKYFEWLADDEGDLQFEIWPTQMLRTDGSGQETFNGETEFINEGTVDFGGSVGATGEEGLWVPSYMFEDNPDFIIPSSLRDNAEYRAQLINASMGTYEGASEDATDFVALYADSANFDSPTYTTPTVWTSVPSYFGSEYSRDLVSTAPNNLEMNFVATGSESSLAAMVQELYAARQPFIAYMYTLDVNFGREDAATGELQQFEKLAYPSYSEQGFEDRASQFAVAPISKMANPLLAERFPEAYEFFQLFEMSTPQINLLVSKYQIINEDASNVATSTERWLYAACDWMKDEQSTSTWNTGAWEVPFTPRYDCGDDGWWGQAQSGGEECLTAVPSTHSPSTASPSAVPSTAAPSTALPSIPPSTASPSAVPSTAAPSAQPLSQSVTPSKFVLAILCFAAVLLGCCALYLSCSGFTKRTREHGTASIIETFKAIGIAECVGLLFELSDMASDYLFATTLITADNASHAQLGWISLVSAALGFILSMLKFKMTQKFLGHQVVALKEALSRLSRPDHDLKRQDVKNAENRLVQQIRTRYVDLDVIALVISCVEDVPQAMIVVMMVAATSIWTKVSILTLTLSMISFFWKLAQVFAGTCGCKDPSGLARVKYSIMSSKRILVEEPSANVEDE